MGNPERQTGSIRASAAITFKVAGVLLPVLMLAACTLPFTPVSTPVTPAPTVTPQPSSTPVPPTPTPTPVPPPDPAEVAATVAAGEARVGEAGVDPLCLRREDLDGEGDLEWVGLYHLPGDPAQLFGFVIDGDTWHDLGPPEGSGDGLGEYPTCELQVGDMNGDGRVEIAIWGHVGSSTDLLHIFAWDGERYALLGAFEGDGGVRVEDANGDLAEDVIVRLRPEGDLVREIVYTWDGTHYAWTWDRYAWFYLDRPRTYVDDTPLHVLASFYLAVDDRDLPGAFGLLSPAAQTSLSYEGWALGFSTTLEAEVGTPRVISQSGDQAAVAAQVQALDNVQGRILATLYDVEWDVVETGEGWRLEGGTSEVLAQWEVSYYR